MLNGSKFCSMSLSKRSMSSHAAIFPLAWLSKWLQQSMKTKMSAWVTGWSLACDWLTKESTMIAMNRLRKIWQTKMMKNTKKPTDSWEFPH